MTMIGKAINDAVVKGDLVIVDIEANGDKESAVPVWCPLGVRYPQSALAKGALFLLLPFDGPSGEFVAIPGGFLNAAVSSEPVARRSDVEAVDARVTALDNKLATHAHSTGGAPVGYLPTEEATITGSDPFEVT